MQQQIENEQMMYEETAKNVYENLRAIDATKYIEKKNGLSYVSWANALHLALTEYPLMQWEIREFDGLPYHKTECGFFVEVSVTIEGIKRSCKLPVLDYKNQTVAKPNAFQINTSHQRALTKCLALHGMALYVYAGEDLPFSHSEETQKPVYVGINYEKMDLTMSEFKDCFEEQNKDEARKLFASMSDEEKAYFWKMPARPETLEVSKRTYELSQEQRDFIRSLKVEMKA